MTYDKNILAAKLTVEYGMKCKVFDLSEDVYFFGTELECYKLAYKMKGKETKVQFSTNMESWVVSVYDFFTTEFAQLIDAPNSPFLTA